MIKIDVYKDFLEFFQAKRDICNYLISKEEIEKEMELAEFINYLDFSKSILLIDSSITFPFKYYKLPDGEEYLFYMLQDENQSVDTLIKHLTDINFDMSNLEEKDKYEIAKEELLDKPFFIINGKPMFNFKK